MLCLQPCGCLFEQLFGSLALVALTGTSACQPKFICIRKSPFDELDAFRVCLQFFDSFPAPPCLITLFSLFSGLAECFNAIPKNVRQCTLTAPAKPPLISSLYDKTQVQTGIILILLIFARALPSSV